MIKWYNKTLGLVCFLLILFFRHVFKRLKFLGNKTLSHVTTLFFLTIWHGLHSGYFLCFSMEFFIITVERQVRYRWRESMKVVDLKKHLQEAQTTWLLISVVNLLFTVLNVYFVNKKELRFVLAASYKPTVEFLTRHSLLLLRGKAQVIKCSSWQNVFIIRYWLQLLLAIISL